MEAILLSVPQYAVLRWHAHYTALGLMSLALVVATVGEDYVQDMLYGSGMGLFGAGDVFGALSWGFSLWFCR